MAKDLDIMFSKVIINGGVGVNIGRYRLPSKRIDLLLFLDRDI